MKNIKIALITFLLILTTGFLSNLTAQDETPVDVNQKVAVPTEADAIATEIDKVLPSAQDALDKAAKQNVKKGSENNTTTTESSTTTSTTTTKEGGPNDVGGIGGTKSGTNRVYSDGKVTYASCQTKFELQSSDSLSRLAYIEYRIDDSPLRKYRTPISIEQEGIHRITYRGVDKVGNIEAEQILEIVIDCTPPSMSILTEPSQSEKDGLIYLPAKSSLTINSVDKYSGIDKIEYSVNGAAYAEYKTPIKFEEIAAGKSSEATVKYKATDKLGNVTEEAIYKVNLDAMPPSVKIVPLQRFVTVDGKNYSLRTNNFTVEAADPDSGLAKVLIKIDGEKDFQIYTSAISFSVEGEHSIQAKAIDVTGNESEVVSVSMLVDDNSPRTTIKPIGVEVVNDKKDNGSSSAQ